MDGETPSSRSRLSASGLERGRGLWVQRANVSGGRKEKKNINERRVSDLVVSTASIGKANLTSSHPYALGVNLMMVWLLQGER